jgi:hypothetical protein
MVIRCLGQFNGQGSEGRFATTCQNMWLLYLILCMKSVKTRLCLMLFIYLFSICDLFKDYFSSSECIAFDGSVISE